MAVTSADVQALSLASDLDLAHFRPAHLEARIARALTRSRLDDIQLLGSALRRDEVLRESFRRSVAISVTGFFRDAEQFDLLERHLGWLEGVARPRIWSAGCSDGSELWSMAVVLARLGLEARAQLLGSDLLLENVLKARGGLDHGTLGGHELPAGVTPRFEVRDLVAEPTPPGQWHVVLCRNVAIYFGPEARAAVHAKLAASLVRGGLLLLGRSERLADARGLGMEPVAPHLYRRVS